MLAFERREKIRALIQTHRNLKISQLSEMLDVSEMTIHRDIKLLAQEGVIIKTFGGITLGRDFGEDKPSNSGDCVYCSRKVDPRLTYRLILPDNKVESTCCSHCGLLRHRQLSDKVIQAICHDFFFHTTISAPMAWFVMDSSLDIGCCQPQALAFAKKDHADGLVMGFGGQVLSFDEAMEKVHIKMGCCCKEKTGIPPTNTTSAD